MFELNRYLISFISAVIIITQAMSMLGTYVPRVPRMRKYRKSRLILVCAYFVLAIPEIMLYFGDKQDIDAALNNALILMIASFESLLFTMALITLLQPDYLTYKHLFFQSLVPLFITVCLIPPMFMENPVPLEMVFYVTIVLFSFQLCYYLWLFHKKYKLCLEQVDDYYAEEEERRFLWIKQVFYMSLSIGILSLVSPLFNPLVYNLFTIAYTIFYVYLTCNFNNYVILFQQIFPAVSHIEAPIEETIVLPPVEEKEAEPLLPYSENDLRLELSIKEWVKQKKYTETAISLDDIAVSLGTNRSYLSRHLNSRMNTNFKSWRTQLRIEEAQRLLITHPEMSIVEVGTMVGIYDRTNFHHRFQKVTGMTPTEWRNLHLHKKEIEKD